MYSQISTDKCSSMYDIGVGPQISYTHNNFKIYNSISLLDYYSGENASGFGTTVKFGIDYKIKENLSVGVNYGFRYATATETSNLVEECDMTANELNIKFSFHF